MLLRFHETATRLVVACQHQARIHRLGIQSDRLLVLSFPLFPIHNILKEWCLILRVARTNIDIDEGLIRKARKLTHLKTKRQIVDKALELLVRSESRKGILRYYGRGIWRGDLEASRRNRV